MKKLLTAAAAVCFVGSFGSLAFAQAESPKAAQPSQAETTADVPELDAFHEVIFPLWHRAYPAQDTTMMRKLWPEVAKDEEAVQKAELPGILRDKKDAWQKGLEALHAAKTNYGEALAAGDKKMLLEAARQLHTSFEDLVSIVHPTLPQMASFHEVLYQIYHYDMPQKDLTTLFSHAQTLKAAMDSLNAAVLPARLASKKDEFMKARADLSEKVTTFHASMRGSDWDAVVKAIEEVHTAYQNLDKISD
jgi:hypothetical protein